MKNNYLFLTAVLVSCFINNAFGEDHPQLSQIHQSFLDEIYGNSSISAHPNANLHHEKRLSDSLFVILDHYKQDDPEGLPGAPIPDPLEIPPLKHKMSAGTMNLNDCKLYGLKKFKIQHVKIDVAAMKIEAALIINQLDVLGNYTLRSWLSTGKGPFTAQLKNVSVKASSSLEVQKNGSLEAQAIDIDVKFKDISMDFKGLGFLASLAQGMINSMGSFLFDSIKPYILKEVNQNVRADLNKELRKIPQTFPNSISPLDQLIGEARKKVRNMGYDPYKIPEYNTSVGMFEIYLTHTWLFGASSFHRTKDIIFEVKNHTVHALLEIGTQKLLGTSDWDIELLAGFMGQNGRSSFSLDYIKVTINASQSLDTSKPPILDGLKIVLGNIQTRFDGLGTMDYVIEFGVNVIPNLLRYQLMDALEKPIRQRIQQELDRINIEELLKENRDKIDNLDVQNLT